MLMSNGEIYIVLVDYYLLVEVDRSFVLDFSEKVYYSWLSIDVVFEFVCDVYGSNMCGILFFGVNLDGVVGMKCLVDVGV